MHHVASTNLWDSSDEDTSAEHRDDTTLTSVINPDNRTGSSSTAAVAAAVSSMASSVNTGNISRLALLPAFPSLHQDGVAIHHGCEHLLLANQPRMYNYTLVAFTR